jgi:hypothetical protein
MRWNIVAFTRTSARMLRPERSLGWRGSAGVTIAVRAVKKFAGLGVDPVSVVGAVGTWPFRLIENEYRQLRLLNFALTGLVNAALAGNLPSGKLQAGV